MSNCKTEASAKTLLQYCPDDLKESLPEEVIHFSTLIKQHYFNSECKEIQMFRFVNKKCMHFLTFCCFQAVPLSDDF